MEPAARGAVDVAAAPRPFINPARVHRNGVADAASEHGQVAPISVRTGALPGGAVACGSAYERKEKILA
jgi:hypothetical protein